MASYFKFNEKNRISNINKIKENELINFVKDNIIIDYIDHYRIKVYDYVKNNNDEYISIALDNEFYSSRILINLKNSNVLNIFYEGNFDFKNIKNKDNFKLVKTNYRISNSKFVVKDGKEYLVLYNPSLQVKRIDDSKAGPFILIYDLNSNEFIYEKDAKHISIIERDNDLILTRIEDIKKLDIYYSDLKMYLFYNLFKTKIERFNLDNSRISVLFDNYVPISLVEYKAGFFRKGATDHYLKNKKEGYVLISELIEDDGFVLRDIEYKFENNKIYLRDLRENKNLIDDYYIYLYSDVERDNLKYYAENFSISDLEKIDNYFERMNLKLRIIDNKLVLDIKNNNVEISNKNILRMVSNCEEFYIEFKKNNIFNCYYFVDTELKNTVNNLRRYEIVLKHDQENIFILNEKKDLIYKLNLKNNKKEILDKEEYFKDNNVVFFNNGDIFLTSSLIINTFNELIFINNSLKKSDLKSLKKYLDLIRNKVNIVIADSVFYDKYIAYTLFNNKIYKIDSDLKLNNYCIFYDENDEFLVMFDTTNISDVVGQIGNLSKSDLVKVIKDSIFFIEVYSGVKYFRKINLDKLGLNNLDADSSFYDKKFLRNMILKLYDIDISSRGVRNIESQEEIINFIFDLKNFFNHIMLKSFRKKNNILKKRKII